MLPCYITAVKHEVIFVIPESSFVIVTLTSSLLKKITQLQTAHTSYARGGGGGCSWTFHTQVWKNTSRALLCFWFDSLKFLFFLQPASRGPSTCFGLCWERIWSSLWIFFQQSEGVHTAHLHMELIYSFSIYDAVSSSGFFWSHHFVFYKIVYNSAAHTSLSSGTFAAAACLVSHVRWNPGPSVMLRHSEPRPPYVSSHARSSAEATKYCLCYLSQKCEAAE